VKWLPLSLLILVWSMLCQIWVCLLLLAFCSSCLEHLFSILWLDNWTINIQSYYWKVCRNPCCFLMFGSFLILICSLTYQWDLFFPYFPGSFPFLWVGFVEVFSAVLAQWLWIPLVLFIMENFYFSSVLQDSFAGNCNLGCQISSFCAWNTSFYGVLGEICCSDEFAFICDLVLLSCNFPYSFLVGYV
jgi:hypothetical protein